MNHKEFVAAIASKLNIPQAIASDLLDKTVSTCVDLLADQKTIGFQSFGNFEVKKKEERVSVHPVTQLRTLIPPKLVVSFKQSTVLKEKLKDIRTNE